MPSDLNSLNIRYLLFYIITAKKSIFFNYKMFVAKRL